MSSRLGWILLALVAAWGCDRRQYYSEPPADSYTSAVFQLRTASTSIPVDGARVSDEFWRTTKVHPALGRPFVSEEYAGSAAPVVLLSHDLWEQSFHSDPGVIGQAVDLDGVPTTVVGVLPPGFQFPEGARLWVPRTAGSE